MDGVRSLHLPEETMGAHPLGGLLAPIGCGHTENCENEGRRPSPQAQGLGPGRYLTFLTVSITVFNGIREPFGSLGPYGGSLYVTPRKFELKRTFSKNDQKVPKRKKPPVINTLHSAYIFYMNNHLVTENCFLQWGAWEFSYHPVVLTSVYF